VVEHLNPPLATCKEILRILEPSEVAAMVTPNTSVPLPFIRFYAALTGNRKEVSRLRLMPRGSLKSARQYERVSRSHSS
jgi:hypothetical protein